MKKILALLFSVLLCFSFSSCIITTSDEPKKETYHEEKATSEKTEEKKEETTFGLNETAVFDSLKFTATELKESAGTQYFTPESGEVFVGIKFVIENVSDTEQSVSSMLMFEAYADDVKLDYSVSASVVFDEGTLDGTIAPGKKLVGWYSLEVPENWASVELMVRPDILSTKSAKFILTK